MHCLQDIADVVEQSSTAGINVACLIRQEDGSVLVPVHDWSTFLEKYFEKVNNIKTYHHFTKDTTGMKLQHYSDTEPSYQELLKVTRHQPRSSQRILISSDNGIYTMPFGSMWQAISRTWFVHFPKHQ